jgi:RNase P subunit RPR2
MMTSDVDNDGGWRWLKSTRQLQQSSFGVDYIMLTGDKLSEYLVHNGFALVAELIEAFQEVQWKNWANNRGSLNRDAMAGELIDTAHFLANIAVAIGMDDEEWERLYREKQERNRVRQSLKTGYDAKSTKCPGCRRELDKPGAMVLVRSERSRMMVRCSYCDQSLGMVGGSEIYWQAGVFVPGVTSAMLFISEQADG